MKRPAVRIIVVAAILAVIGVGSWWAWNFYHQQLRGAGPAIYPPKQDIAELVDKREAPLDLPPGYSLTIFAKGLGDPRVLVTDPNGVVVVSVPSRGEVIALPDAKIKEAVDRQVVILQKLNRPHGLAFRCVDRSCRLYVAEENALKVYDYDAATFKATNPKKLADLPSSGRHITRSLLFLPPPNDDQLLVAIGSDCDTCHEQDTRRGTIQVINVDGGAMNEYAKGLRNSVFQAVNLTTKQVWATEMGRDYLGDNLPPDEINIIESGKNYGWPNCYGQNIHDTVFDKNTYIRNPCMAPFETPSWIDIPAHSAPLGLAFDGLSLYVAYHGSWNRSVPTGYKVVRYTLGANGEMRNVEDFITGWLRPDGTALGRPAGLLVRSAGELFISDDKAGVVYRVTKTK